MNFQQLKARIPVMSYGRAPLLIIIAGRIGIAIAGVVVVRVSTVLLTPDQIGSINLLNSIATFFSLFLVVPVMHFMNRGFLEWYDRGILASNSIKYISYLLFVSFFAFAISGILQLQLKLVNGFSSFWIAVLIGITTFLQSVYNFSASGLNLFGQRGRFVFFANLVAWSSLLFSFLFFTWNPDIVSWSLGPVSGFLLGCLAIIVLWKKIKKKDFSSLPAETGTIFFSLKKIFSFSWPIVITSLLWWTQSQSYRFILEGVQGLKNVGLFSVAYALAAMPIMMYESIIGQYLDPVFFGDLKNNDRNG